MPSKILQGNLQITSIGLTVGKPLLGPIHLLLVIAKVKVLSHIAVTITAKNLSLGLLGKLSPSHVQPTLT